MVIDLVDHHDVEPAFFQMIHKLQTAESATYHHNLLFHNPNK